MRFKLLGTEHWSRQDLNDTGLLSKIIKTERDILNQGTEVIPDSRVKGL